MIATAQRHDACIPAYLTNLQHTTVEKRAIEKASQALEYLRLELLDEALDAIRQYKDWVDLHEVSDVTREQAGNLFISQTNGFWPESLIRQDNWLECSDAGTYPKWRRTLRMMHEAGLVLAFVADSERHRKGEPYSTFNEATLLERMSCSNGLLHAHKSVAEYDRLCGENFYFCLRPYFIMDDSKSRIYFSANAALHGTVATTIEVMDTGELHASKVFTDVAYGWPKDHLALDVYVDLEHPHLARVVPEMRAGMPVFLTDI